MATVQIPIRGVCGVCKQYVYANQDREKDPATGVYKHRNPHDCKVMATVQQPASTTHLADVGGPSAGAGRAKRWGDGLEAAAAGTRHFVPPGFAVKMAPKFFMPQGKETHIFLSHNRGKLADGRDNHAIVVAVAKRLEALGFVVWLDDIDMKGNLVDQMCKGIDKTCIFIAIMTQMYIDKCAGKGERGAADHCKREFEYAVEELGIENMLAVVTELCCLDLKKTWHGCVKFNLGSTLYMDVTAAEDSAAFGRQVQTLGDKLLQMLAASYGVSAVAAQASPAPAVAGAVSSGGTGFFNRIGISDQADGQQLQSFGIRSPQDLMVLDLADITEMTQNMSFSTKKALKVFVQLSPEEKKLAFEGSSAAAPSAPAASSPPRPQGQLCVEAEPRTKAQQEEREAFRRAIGSEDDIETLVRGMATYPSDPAIQEKACWRLFLAAGDDKKKVTIANLGGIQALLKAMKDHATQAKVQEHACAALWNLGGLSGNATKVKITNLGGAMKEHAAEAKVQEEACAALSSLAFNDDNKVTIANLAMKDHLSEEEVQERACSRTRPLSKRREGRRW